jgi:hypothetical protein
MDVATPRAPSLETKDPFQMNFAYFVKSMLGTFHDDSFTEPQDDLLVITSVVPALERRNQNLVFFSPLSIANRHLKSYHFTAALITPGHLK